MTADSARQKYTSEHKLRSGVNFLFRPIECSDQLRFKEFFGSLSAASVHFRFFEIIKELPNESVERFCNVDYSQEIAIVALPQGENKIVGVARLEVEPKARRGEFALVVADAWQGRGLGIELLGYLIRIARDYALLELHCFVSSDNLRMIGLAEKFGLRVKSSEGEVLDMSLHMENSDIVPFA